MNRNREIRIALLAAVVTLAGSAADTAKTSATAPLHLYSGSWKVVRQGLPPGAKPEELKNECALAGRFFACQQSVNRTVTGLLIIIPATSPGHYATQNVEPNGRATGLGELQIEGNKWVFLSTWNQGAKTIRYRTTNVFSGRDRIHFEQEESDDGRKWKTTGSGETTRIK